MTPTVTGGAITIGIGTAVGHPGRTVGFAVTLLLVDRFQIVGVRNCISIDPAVPFAHTATQTPECTVNPALQKDAVFAFGPAGCNPELDCQSMCADVSGPAGSPPIPEKAMLYSCRIAIPSTTATATYPLACGAVNQATNAQGANVAVECRDGEAIVETRVTGDCNGDGVVTINELVTGVNIALDILPVTACPAFDTNATGGVSIDQLILAVNAALAG